MCTAVLTGWDPAGRNPPPSPCSRIWAHTRALFVCQPRKTTSLCDPLYLLNVFKSFSISLPSSKWRHWHLWTFAISSLSPPSVLLLLLLLLFLNHIIVVALWIHLHLGSGDSDVRRRRGDSRSCDRGTRTASHRFPCMIFIIKRRISMKIVCERSTNYCHWPKARWSGLA